MGLFTNITGQRFGRLVAVERVENNRHNHAVWRWRCDCGNETVLPTGAVRTGNTRSCGCLRRERTSALGRANRTHGMFGTREYATWASMVSRCENPNLEYFKY